MADGPQVVFAYIHPGNVSASFAFSMVRLFCYEGVRVGWPPRLIAQRCGSGRIVEGRNDVAKEFLETGIEWLFFVDADMGFAEDTIEQLVGSADPKERPIVGALCFGQKAGDPTDQVIQAEYMRQFPTVYAWVEREDEVGFQVVPEYPRDSLVQVSASGAACFVVHRSVLEAIGEKFGPQWFTPAVHPKGKDGPTEFGEDMSFFIRAAACDKPVFVNTAVKTSHDKGGIFLTEETWDRQQRLAVSDGAAA